MTKNNKVINSFCNEWNKFDQSNLNFIELNKIFNDYFKIFTGKYCILPQPYSQMMKTLEIDSRRLSCYLKTNCIN